MEQTWQWIVDHQLLAWIILSLIINSALAQRSAAQWVSLVERYPRAASVIRLLRGVGVDPVKLIEGMIGVVTAKARVPATATATPIIPAPPRVPTITEK